MLSYAKNKDFEKQNSALCHCLPDFQFVVFFPFAFVVSCDKMEKMLQSSEEYCMSYLCKKDYVKTVM